MESFVQEGTGALAPALEQTKRGRPRKHPLKDESAPKRARGRPRKHPQSETPKVKRGRGRPRKYPIVEKEILPNGEIKPNFRKVESGHLLKHMLNYFTKLLILHSKLAQESSKFEEVFNRLKHLDFQMAEICRTILDREYNAEGTEGVEEDDKAA